MRRSKPHVWRQLVHLAQRDEDTTSIRWLLHFGERFTGNPTRYHSP